MDNTPLHSDTPEYSDSTQSIQLKHVSSRHRAMMRYLVAGKTPGEVSEIFAITPAHLSVITSSPLFKEEKEKMEKEVNKQFAENEGGKIHTDTIRQKLQEEALASLNTLIGLRDVATSEGIRQKSALEILDRAGYKAAERIEGSVEIDATEGLINAIQTALKQMQAPIVVKEENGKLE